MGFGSLACLQHKICRCQKNTTKRAPDYTSSTLSSLLTAEHLVGTVSVTADGLAVISFGIHPVLCRHVIALQVEVPAVLLRNDGQTNKSNLQRTAMQQTTSLF